MGRFGGVASCDSNLRCASFSCPAHVVLVFGTKHIMRCAVSFESIMNLTIPSCSIANPIRSDRSHEEYAIDSKEKVLLVMAQTISRRGNALGPNWLPPFDRMQIQRVVLAVKTPVRRPKSYVGRCSEQPCPFSWPRPVSPFGPGPCSPAEADSARAAPACPRSP